MRGDRLNSGEFRYRQESLPHCIGVSWKDFGKVADFRV